MKNILILTLCFLSPWVLADLQSLEEFELESVTGKGVTIDAQLDFAATPILGESNWLAYRRNIYDDSGNSLIQNDGTYSDGNNDGFIDGLTLFNSATLQNDKIRVPYYIILGPITGRIKLEGLEFNLASQISYDVETPLGRKEVSIDKPSLQWTLPEFISFEDFKIEGLYVSKDQIIDVAGATPDNRVIGLEVNGNLYMPARPKAFVFITNN